MPVCNTTVVCNEPSEFLEFDLHLEDLICVSVLSLLISLFHLLVR